MGQFRSYERIPVLLAFLSNFFQLCHNSFGSIFNSLPSPWPLASQNDISSSVNDEHGDCFGVQASVNVVHTSQARAGVRH